MDIVLCCWEACVSGSYYYDIVARVASPSLGGLSRHGALAEGYLLILRLEMGLVRKGGLDESQLGTEIVI